VPSLRELQQQFAASLLDVGIPADAADIRSDRLPASARLRIYRNNMFVSLTNALAACYPVVRRLVGEDCFKEQARQYIRSHELRSPNLHQYGGGFADFLSTSPDVRTLPYLADVAQLEWACQQVYHAPTATHLSLEELATVDTGQYHALRFHLNPSTRLVASSYPIFQIWRANQSDQQDDYTISLDGGGDWLLVMRRDDDIEIKSIKPADWCFLRALADGATLHAAFTRGIAADLSFDLAKCLREHILGRTLIGFSSAAA